MKFKGIGDNCLKMPLEYCDINVEFSKHRSSDMNNKKIPNDMTSCEIFIIIVIVIHCSFGLLCSMYSNFLNHPDL